MQGFACVTICNPRNLSTKLEKCIENWYSDYNYRYWAFVRVRARTDTSEKTAEFRPFFGQTSQDAVFCRTGGKVHTRMDEDMNSKKAEVSLTSIYL